MEIIASVSSTAFLTWLITRWYFYYQKPKFAPLQDLYNNLISQTSNKNELQRLKSRYDELIFLLKNRCEQPKNNENGIDLETLLENKIFYICQPTTNKSTNWFNYNENTKNNFIYLKPSENKTFILDDSSDFQFETNKICKNLFEDLNQLDLDILFKKNQFINDNKLVYIIIDITYCIVKTSNNVDKFYSLLRKKITSILPYSQLIIEISLSNDLLEENGEKIINKNFILKNNNSDNSEVYEYILSRNKAFQEYSSGGQFGDILLSDYQIPIEIVNKISSKACLFSNKSWKLINIYGPPGSGKTDLLKYILDNDLVKENYIRIVLNTSIDFNNVYGNNVFTTEDVFINAILNILSNPDNNYLNFFDFSELSLSGVRDVLFQIIRNRGKELVLIIDDYHIRKDTTQLIEKILEKNWRIKLILVSRPRFDFREQNVVFFETMLWTRDESKMILNSWIPENEELITNALNTKWVYDESFYSTYLLRIIKNHIKSFSYSASSSAFYAEIKNILSPVFNELKKIISSKKKNNIIDELDIFEKYVFQANNINSIIELRDIIVKERKYNEKEIDLSSFINDIGLISLLGRLTHGDKHLSLENIVNWSHFFSIESAEKLLKEGSNAGIFYPYNELTQSCEWKDSLIADGCLALRLNYDLSKINDTETSEERSFHSFMETLNTLKKKNSTYILKLALDEVSLNNLIKINIKHNIDYADVINEDLLTDNLLNKMKLSKNSIKDLFDTIITNLYNLKGEDSFISIAKVLTRIIKIDNNLEHQITDLLNLENTAIVNTSIAVNALIINGRKDFFKKTDAYNINKELSLKIALRLWDTNSIVILIDRIKEVVLNINVNKKDKIAEFWKHRLEYLTSEDVKSNLEQLFKICLDNPIEAEIHIILLECTFLKIRAAIRNRVFYDNTHFIDIIQNAIDRLKNKKKYITVSKLTKWLVYFVQPDLFREEIDWEYMPKENFAIPKKQYEEKNIISILNNIPSNSQFSIPKISDILNLKGYSLNENDASFNKGKFELVSDKFPINFKYNEEDYIPTADIYGNTTIQLKATQIAIWDGMKKTNEVDIIERNKQQIQKLSWRPKIEF